MSTQRNVKLKEQENILASNNEKDKFPLVWMDMEMTGLDPEKNTVIEIATVITDSELNILEQGPTYVIAQPQTTLEAMDKWNRDHHKKSGLWDLVLASQTTIAEAEEATLAFIKKHLPPNKGMLAGNSIWQDRRFLIKHMPRIDQYLFYRMLDVSSVKTLFHYWYKENKFEKSGNHRALEDTLLSIEELKYYRKLMFKN